MYLSPVHHCANGWSVRTVRDLSYLFHLVSEIDK